MAKNRVSFATYPQDYYTGAQARVYFGSVWVDDIATIQYQTSHSKTPLYGYGDHQFRTVVKGQFLVRGSFTIAFKETGYLYQIMQLWKEDKSGLNRLKSLVPTLKTDGEAFLNMLGNGFTIENAMDNLSAKGGNDFEDASEVMENAIWGKEGTPANFSSRIPRADELDYYKYTGGSPSQNAEYKDTDIDREGFDILLTFGNYKSGSDSAEHTVISINDVHITGESMVVSPTAEPIGVTYEFFARGLNERISNNWGDVQTKKDIKKAESPTSSIEPAPTTTTKAPDVKLETASPAKTEGDNKITGTQPAPLKEGDYIITGGPTVPKKEPTALVPTPAITIYGHDVVNPIAPPTQPKIQSGIVIDARFPTKTKYSATYTLRGDVKTILNKAKIEARTTKIDYLFKTWEANVTIEGHEAFGTIKCNDIGKSFTGRYTVINKVIQVDLDSIPTMVSWKAVNKALDGFFGGK